MFSISCAGCPGAPGGCDGCLVSFLESDNAQVGELDPASCGYVLASDVRAAIELLRDVGMVSSVEILAAFRAA